MVARRLRVLLDPPGDAAWNMAVDAALLACADAPTLRLYGWLPHAVSLGYFQRYADFAGLPGDDAVVRRDTGGGAIHHGDELTFALALDADLLPGDVGAGYARLHDAVAAALLACGVACRRVTGGAAQSPRPDERWCFAKPVIHDLVTDRGKLCGSAQRRTRDATGRERVLHHGSLVLSRPRHTPFVAAVADQVEVDDALRADLRARLTAAFADCLGLTATADALTAPERALAARLRDERHGAAAHVRRR